MRRAGTAGPPCSAAPDPVEGARLPPDGTADGPALDVRGLSVAYGGVLGLEGASFRVERGRICALLGMNGAGKSSLFRAVAGDAPVVAGDLRVLGRPVERARREHLIGYLPQSDAVDGTFPITVREVVMMGRYASMPGRVLGSRRPRREDRRAVEAALERVELTELAHRGIGALSGGQRKRAFLARCIAQEAPLLLLDEPFAGVDRVSTQKITGVLRGLAAEGTAVLVSVHELAGVAGLADDAVLLRRRVVHSGPATDLRDPAVLELAFGAREEVAWASGGPPDADAAPQAAVRGAVPRDGGPA